jgi:hypothetical protein
MRRVPTLPGTWSLLLGGVIVLLVSGVAVAAPQYPVNRPTETQFIFSYEPASHITSPGTSTADAANAGTLGPDATTTDVSGSETGPNPHAEMNHGQIVRQIPELVEGRQLGCVIRNVAQFDLGKDDRHLPPDQQSTPTDTTGSVDPSLLETECSNNGGSTKPAPASASQHGPDDRNSSNGKSEDAPGKSK